MRWFTPPALLLAMVSSAILASAQPTRPATPDTLPPPTVAAPAPADRAGSASSSARSIRLDYQATSGCPSQAMFVAKVVERTRRARFVDDADRAELSVHAIIFPSENRYAGSIDIGASTPRTVAGESCADVVTALALIAALTIDPNARATTPPPAIPALRPVSPSPSPPAPSSSAAPAPESPPAASSSAAPALEPRPVAEPRPAAPTPATPTARTSADVPRWLVGFGSRLELSRGLGRASLTMLGASAWWYAAVRLPGSSWLVPGLRAGIRYAVSPSINPGVGAARFTLAAARVDACPARFELGSAILIPYFAFEVGRLEGTGEENGPIVDAYSEQRTWMAWVEGVSVEFEMARRMGVLVSAELKEPVRRYDFIFQDPYAEIAKVSAPEIGVAVGAVVHFR